MGKDSSSSASTSSSPQSVQSASATVAASIFAVSAYWMLQRIRKERTKKFKKLGEQQAAGHCSRLKGLVGSRGEAAVYAPAVPYLKQFLSCLDNQCDPVRNPQGFIPLCIAENRLCLDILIDRCLRMTSSSNAFSDPRTYCYNSFLGMPLARDAAAYFLARRLLFDRPVAADVALRHVQPKHVALATGAAALLNHLFVLLGDSSSSKQQACLIPQPYYAAFDNHMQLVGDIVPIGVKQTNPMLGPSNADLEQAHRAATAKGLTPRFLLLTNPNNPLGAIYSPSTMLRLVTWARQHYLHIIVDELYALSVHKTFDHGFESIIKVLNNELGNDVHLLYAISKDFGASGLRVGFLYSQNELLMEALTSVNIFTCVSGPIQYLVSELLTDDAFVSSFLDMSRNRLVYSYQVCVAKLEEMVLPYYPAEAGIFVYCDFSSLLPQPATLEWETKLSNLMFEYARVVLTPGGTQHDPKPGMFRICYAWVSVEVLQIAMERLSRLVAKIRRMDWDDLNQRSLAGVMEL